MRRLLNSSTGHRRLLHFYVAAMALGLFFLIGACALLGWHFVVSPVPLLAVYVVIGLGALSGTMILIVGFIYVIAERHKRN